MAAPHAVGVGGILDERKFVEALLGIADVVGVEVAGGEAGGDGGDDGGIEASAEEAAEGDVADEAQADGVFEEVPEGIGGLVEGQVGFVGGREGGGFPVSGDGFFAGGGDAHPVAGFEEVDVVEEGGRAHVDADGGEIVGKSGCAEGGFFGEEAQEGGGGGSEAEDAALFAPEEGFDAEAVAREEEGSVGGGEDGEGEHAEEPVEALGAPMEEGLKEDFGVGAGMEGAAGGAQFIAEFAEVVDFAVENDRGAGFGILEGLAAALEVDDGEAAVAEAGVGGEKEAVVVGAAEEHGVEGGLEARPPFERGRRRRGDVADDTAHTRGAGLSYCLSGQGCS